MLESASVQVELDLHLAGQSELQVPGLHVKIVAPEPPEQAAVVPQLAAGRWVVVSAAAAVATEWGAPAEAVPVQLVLGVRPVLGVMLPVLEEAEVEEPKELPSQDAISDTI